MVTSNTVTSDKVFLINCPRGSPSLVSTIFPAYHVCWLYKCSNWNVKQASRGTIFTLNSSHMVRIAGQLLSIVRAKYKKHFENEFRITREGCLVKKRESNSWMYILHTEDVCVRTVRGLGLFIILWHCVRLLQTGKLWPLAWGGRTMVTPLRNKLPCSSFKIFSSAEAL